MAAIAFELRVRLLERVASRFGMIKSTWLPALVVMAGLARATKISLMRIIFLVT